eukprot:scaffold22684_cov63-Phaeocystis_antarctica.AAC.2
MCVRPPPRATGIGADVADVTPTEAGRRRCHSASGPRWERTRAFLETHPTARYLALAGLPVYSPCASTLPGACQRSAAVRGPRTARAPPRARRQKRPARRAPSAAWSAAGPTYEFASDPYEFASDPYEFHSALE